MKSNLTRNLPLCQSVDITDLGRQIRSIRCISTEPLKIHKRYTRSAPRDPRIYVFLWLKLSSRANKQSTLYRSSIGPLNLISLSFLSSSSTFPIPPNHDLLTTTLTATAHNPPPHTTAIPSVIPALAPTTTLVLLLLLLLFLLLPQGTLHRILRVPHLSPINFFWLPNI